jgi:type I restriction enzyme S subunit
MKTETVCLSEIVALERRQVDVELTANYTEIGVRSFGRGLFKKEPITGAQLGTKRVYHVEPGDLVVSNVFAWEGAIAVANETHRDTIGSHRFMTWHVGPHADVGYLYHYLTSDQGLTSLRLASPGSAGRNRTLSIKSFEAIKVPLPPLDEQRRIAAHLDLIAGRQRLVTRTTDVRGAVERVFIASGKPGYMSDLLRLDLDEKRLDPTETYRLMGVYSHGRGAIDRGTFTGHETKYQTMLRVRASQVVVSRLKAFEGAVTVVPQSFHGSMVSKEFPTFSLQPGIERGFVQALLRTRSFRASMSFVSTGVGARRERVSAEQFLTIPVMIPSSEAQSAIAAMEATLQALESTNARRAKVAGALLPAARNEIFSAMR